MALSVPVDWFGQQVDVIRAADGGEGSYEERVATGVLARDSFGPYVHMGGRRPEFELLAGDFLELVDTTPEVV